MTKQSKLLTLIDESNENIGKYRYEEIPLKKIKTNELNRKYFQDSQSTSNNNATPNLVEGNTFQQLVTSIKTMNGIHTPILVTKDYRILSGHRRYLAYCELGYKTIPGLVLSQKIPATLEKFILLDANIQGRHIAESRMKFLKKERLQCYFDMIPGLEARIMSKDAKVTAKEVSAKTGIHIKTVEKDMTELRKEVKKQETREIYKESGIDQNLVNKTSFALGQVVTCYEVANKKTKQELKARIEKFVVKIQKTK